MSRNLLILLALFHLCRSAAADPISLHLVPGGLIFENVAQTVVLLDRALTSPPGRIGAVELQGNEIHILIDRPSETVPVPFYEFTMSAGLPPLAAGTYRLKVYDESLPGGPIFDYPLQIRAAQFALAYAGPPAPTAEDEILVRLSHGPCSGSTVLIERGNFDLRLWGCWIARPEGYLLSLGSLAAGSWNIEVDGEAFPLATLDLEIAEKPPEPGIVLAGDFEVEVSWRTALGEEGEGKLVQPPSQDSALLYFFTPANWELMIKVLNGCAINGHYWVFGAASTDVGYTIEIRRRGSTQTLLAENPIGIAAPAITDITAFPCDPAAPLL